MIKEAWKTNQMCQRTYETLLQVAIGNSLGIWNSNQLKTKSNCKNISTELFKGYSKIKYSRNKFAEKEYWKSSALKYVKVYKFHVNLYYKYSKLLAIKPWNQHMFGI